MNFKAIIKKLRRERAPELAGTMPNMAISREMLVASVETGDDLHRAIQLRDQYLYQFLVREMGHNYPLDSGELAYTLEECAALRDKAITLTHLLFEDGNCGFYHCKLQGLHLHQAKYHADLGDRETALRHLTCAVDAAIRFLEDYASAPGEFVYTSLLFRGLPGGCFSTSGQNNDAAQTLAALEDPVFDLLREDEAFRAMAERLTPYAGKWAV